MSLYDCKYTYVVIAEVITISGLVIIAVCVFPIIQYLRRKDRKYALQQITKQYERLQAAGLMSSASRNKLDQTVDSLIKDMLS